MGTAVFAFPLQYWQELRVQLASESDRGRLMLAGICIEEFLHARFLNEGMRPTSLARMLKHADASRWIDHDVFHDADIIRCLRNRCAHDSSGIHINDEEIRINVERFRVPARMYYDWGQLRAATTCDGLILYAGDRPEEALADLHVPGLLTFHLSIGLLLLVLAANLKVPFATGEPGTAAILELPQFMKLAS